MEKRLQSSLQSSAEEFLAAAAKLPVKSSKSTLKSLIHKIPPSSPLSTSLPLSLRHSISRSILAFQNPLHHHHHPLSPSSPDPDKSPPTKRLRRSGRKHNSQTSTRSEPPDPDDLKQQALNTLQILALVASLCLSHPNKSFSSEDLLPAVQELHDNLILFGEDSNLSVEIANLCEDYWKEDLPGRQLLIPQTLPFLMSRSLTLKKKVDLHRVYAMREAFALFDFGDQSIEDLKMLLIRCVISPLYLKAEEGRRFLGFMFGLNLQLLKEALAMIRSQIPFGRKSILEAYGKVLFRAWKGLDDGVLKCEIEEGFLQGLVEGAIHASSGSLAASIRRVLGGFVSQRISDGVEKLLFRLAEPVIFRSLQVANSNVRLNALHLLLDLFPLEDPDATKEVKDTLLDRQFFLLERLLTDDCPDVRAVAVEGCCRVLHLFWEIIPSPTITKLLAQIFDDMSHDICNEVRVSTLTGIVYLLGNPQSHEILKVLLSRLGHLMLDNALSTRVALVDLLLFIRDIRSFQFNKVVGLDSLLSALANDHSQVAQKITRLLMPSYFPSKVSIEEACNRCMTLIKRSPIAGARFCECAVSEGASPESLMELVRVFITSVLSQDQLNADQIEGLLLAASYLCNNLLNEKTYRNSLKEIFTGNILKCLFGAASTARAQSSILSIYSAVSPDDATELVEECMKLVTKCRELPQNIEMQTEVRSAHKLLLACDGFEDMLEAITRLLQKAAYRCHIKFGIEMPKQRVSPRKRKKCRSSVKSSAKWKRVSGKNASSFEEDYLIAAGIAWQIKDLLAHDGARKSMLGSEALEVPFLALKVISEASIVQCVCCEFMEATPVLAYADLALHMTLQNVTISCENKFISEKNSNTDSPSLISQETVFNQTVNHLLDCIEKLLGAVDIGVSSNMPTESMQHKRRTHHCGEKQREPQSGTSGSNDGGSHHIKGKKMSNKVKMLTAVLKFIVDSHAMGLLSHTQGRSLNFTSAYLKHVIAALGQQSSEGMQFKEDELKEIVLCLKSSFSYAAKLLNLILRETSETSERGAEAFDLANNMLDLIASFELHFGSSFTARLVAASKSWLPDLILGLGSWCIPKRTELGSTFSTAMDQFKAHCPSWPSILVKSELSERSEVSSDEEDDRISESQAFPMFKKFMGMMVSLLKGNPKILDAVGAVCLIGSVIGLERQDFELVTGILNFVCVKLVGQEDREWRELDEMLACLPDIYPQIEREIEEQTNEDAKLKLQRTRALLEPVWLYHIYETGRFSVTEEET